MPLSDVKVRNPKPRDKAYKVSDFEGLFVLVKINGSKLWPMKYGLSIAEITAPLILKTLRKVEAKGRYETAHHLRARIGSVFRYAFASDVTDSDPA